MDLFSNSKMLSDSQATFYEASVRKIITDYRSFLRFRRIYDYREILEHVDFELGLSYMDRINKLNPSIFKQSSKFKLNDAFGKPRTYKYADLGKFSPTTLRYIAVACELENLFDSDQIKNIVEIGGGYGGQAAILSKRNYFNQYTIYDLKEVQVLISMYLKTQGIGHVNYPSTVTAPDRPYDLAISNYAFSELPIGIQKEYLEKVLVHARNGYLIMNSGRQNETGRSQGKLSIVDIRAKIPNIQILDELPKTGEDNYVLYWVDQLSD